jgi:PleD family two-component response regulator
VKPKLPPTSITLALCGLAAFSMPPASPGTAVQAADRLMYRAKAQGKGRIVSERY